MRALDTLRKNSSIVIKPADKGGGIVILNTMDYEKEVFRQLEDSEYYESIFSNPPGHISNLIK